MHHPLPDDPLTKLERRGLWVLLATFLIFAAIVEWRAAFMQTRKGDQEVYFWTAYAVRSGDNLYDVVDSHGWHYVYPPLFAILMVPFSEKPTDHPIDLWTLPYGASVALWFLLNVCILLLAIHMLACTVEETAPSLRSRFRSRRWWALRILPLMVCLPACAHTLSRGQVNLLILALIVGTATATMRGRSWQAGLWLSGAISIKVIPAFLLIYPLWRRDARCLAGCAVGLLIGLGVVPLAVFGPERTLIYYQDFVTRVLLPGMAQGEDKSRAAELINMTATPSLSLVSVMHNTLHPPWTVRPLEAAPIVRAVHWLIGGLLTVLTLWASGWRQPTSGPAALLFLGCLTQIMILVSPVCHPHYLCLAAPLVMGLLAVQWEGKATLSLGIGWRLLLGLVGVTYIVLVLPGMETVRDVGVGLYPVLALLLAAIGVLYQRSRRELTAGSEPGAVTRQAA